MKLLKLFTIGSLLLTSAIYADGFGFNIGPFNMQFEAGEPSYIGERRVGLDNPICRAIERQNRLDMVVEGTEKVNDKEMKIITKRIVIEPYAFGMTREGKPVLRGNVVDEKLIKEVTVKYGEDTFEADKNSTDPKKKGYFSGWFKSDKNQNIDIRKLSDIHLIEDSHFDAPKNYKGLREDNIQVVCELPVTKD